MAPAATVKRSEYVVSLGPVPWVHSHTPPNVAPGSTPLGTVSTTALVTCRPPHSRCGELVTVTRAVAPATTVAGAEMTGAAQVHDPSRSAAGSGVFSVTVH